MCRNLPRARGTTPSSRGLRQVAATCRELLSVAPAATCGKLRQVAVRGNLRQVAATCGYLRVAATCGYLRQVAASNRKLQSRPLAVSRCLPCPTGLPVGVGRSNLPQVESACLYKGKQPPLLAPNFPLAGLTLLITSSRQLTVSYRNLHPSADGNLP